MMMKYFRFLYGETGRCFMHLGEIRDTKTAEHFTFLYLRGVNGHVNQTEVEHTLFLCPKSLDLVVLGNSDEDSVETMREFLADAAVDTLIYRANLKFAIPEIVPGVKRVVCLDDEPAEAGNGMPGYQMKAAGWKLTVRCCGKDSLMLSHGLAEHIPETNVVETNVAETNVVETNVAETSIPETSVPAKDREENGCGTAANAGAGLGGKDTYPYKDCVMNVKIVDEEKKCCLEREIDGYGCALGCSLHQDYDVCNYQRKAAQDYVTGTVLLPEECGGPECEALIQELKGELPEIRFFGLPGMPDSDVLSAVLERERTSVSKHKRYFIGSGSELSDESIAAVSRSSMYHIPLILEPGKALCCSGLLKYCE